MAIFGVIALLAAVLVTFMPETSNTPLPDTIKVFDNDDRDDGDYDVLNTLFSFWNFKTLKNISKEGEQLGKGDTFWSSLCTRRRKNSTTE